MPMIARAAALGLLLLTTTARADVWLQVLGIAQDAGYPQIGCERPDCKAAWQDATLRRLASSVAVIDTESNQHWLFDASPHISEQLHRLQSASPDSSLAGVFVTHAHIGHYVGLMFLGHEAMGASDVPVYAMPRMREFLSSNGPWDQLVRYGNIELRDIADGNTVTVSDRVRVTPLQVPHRDEYSETVGFRIEGPNKSAVYIPDIDKWEHWDTDIRDVVKGVDHALLDGTFYDPNELPGRDMSKVLHPFIVESMALFDTLDARQREKVIFIHLNQSNVLVRGDKEALEAVEQRGYHVAREGMRLDL